MTPGAISSNDIEVMSLAGYIRPFWRICVCTSA